MNKDRLNTILVVDTFPNTSLGFLAVLQFPEKRYPQIGMIIKKSEEEYWRIKGYDRGKPPEFTLYTNLESDSYLYGCTIVNEKGENKPIKGDVLYL